MVEKHENLVAGLNPRGIHKARGGSKRLVAWATTILLLLLSLFWAPTRIMRGVLAVIVLFLLVIGALAWVGAAATRLSASGRDPNDFVNPP
jgi:hypothetical protein